MSAAGSPTPFPPDANLFALFEARARATPAAPAIVTDAGDTSYGALLGRATGIAGHLARHGVVPEQPVGVLMERTPDLIAALLGILAAGGAYVPLDPDDPAERNRRILLGSGLRLVLGNRRPIESMRACIAGSGVADTRIEFAEVERIATPDAATPHPPVAPGGPRLAYILHTSGSTGEPKGVEVEHGSVVHLLRAARDLFGFTASDCYLAASTIGFDISVAEIFLPLVTGGRLLLRDRNLWLEPKRLVEDIRRFGVTVVQTGPSTWSVLLAEVPEFPRVRVAISTAEAIPVELARRLVRCGEQVWNLYGPTEATVWATGHRLDDDARLAAMNPAASAPIGRALPGAIARILGADGGIPPLGEPGELCVGGPGLARGYRGNETLTRERFIVHHGERLYRTGDLCAMSDAGVVLYFGRNDDQMKVRGVRIEPGEVEAALLAHPAVRQAAATWFEAAPGTRSVVAAVVVAPGAAPAPGDLHRWLETRLPPQMIPSRFLLRDALPLSPAGKVDRNAIRAELREAAATAPEATGPPAGDALPRTPTEAALMEIWRDTLDLAAVGPRDHFFTIGGDSLAAVRMITAVESRFGVSLPVQAAFEAPTLERLAARIEHARARAGGRDEAGFLFPLTEAAHGLPLFFSEVDLRLARRSAWRVPCSLYAISHWAQGHGFVKADSLADLARVQIAGIRRLQPSGPYRIAGFSFGGLVAFEIAQQLRRDGQEVELLFLLDPMQPFQTDAGPAAAGDGRAEGLIETLPARLRRHLAGIARQPARVVPYVWSRALAHARDDTFRQWLVYQLVHLHGRRPNAISTMLLPKDRWPAFWFSGKRMARGYVARPYSGRVHAVFPDRGERCQTWEKLLGPDADVRVVDSRHDSYFAEPAMTEWMDSLSRHIEALDSGAGQSSTTTLRPTLAPSDSSARK